MNNFKLYLYHIRFIDKSYQYDDDIFIVFSGDSIEEAFEQLKYRVPEAYVNGNYECLKVLHKVIDHREYYLFGDGEYYRFYQCDQVQDQHPTAVYNIKEEQTTAEFPDDNEYWDEPIMKAIKILERKRKIKNIINEHEK